MKRYRVLLILFFLLLSACQPESDTPSIVENADIASLSLTSSAFKEGETIPVQYSCDGEDLSPKLTWSDPPEGTQSLALIMDDPDTPSGDYVHWVLYNLPASSRSLPQAVASDAALPDGSLHGRNSGRDYGYRGPCPPSGTHRYFFKLYALDILLETEPGLDKQALLDAMQGHILAAGQLMGRFSR